MEKLRAKMLLPVVTEDTSAAGNSADVAASSQFTATEQAGATAKPKLAALGRSKLAKWNLLKRNISFTAAGKGAHTSRSRRLHVLGQASQQGGASMENTYRMNPDHQAIFRPIHVQKEIADVLEGVLGSMEYNPSTSGRITTRLSEAIKTRIKALQMKRHKLVVQVVLGSHSGQSLEIASRCLWNQDTDNYATASYQNTSLFAIASVYGIYFE